MRILVNNVDKKKELPKKLYTLILQGNTEIWDIDIRLSPTHFPTYQEDSLPIIEYPFTTKWESFLARFFPKGRLYSIDLEGDEHSWSFSVYLTKKRLEALEKDGLNCFYEVENVIPYWVVEWNLTRAWCICQDLLNLNFRHLFINKRKLL